jgi:hypothetical protein
MAESLIRWTSLISDIVMMDPLICRSSITPMTTFVWSLARDQNLRR